MISYTSTKVSVPFFFIVFSSSYAFIERAVIFVYTPLFSLTVTLKSKHRQLSLINIGIRNTHKACIAKSQYFKTRFSREEIVINLQFNMTSAFYFGCKIILRFMDVCGI